MSSFALVLSLIIAKTLFLCQLALRLPTKEGHVSKD